MTTIVGVQGRDWAVLAGDNQTTYGEVAFKGTSKGKIKTFGTLAIGTSGDGIACQILMNLWKPQTKPSYKDPDLYLAEVLIPSMKAVLDNNGYEADKEHKKEDGGVDTLLVVGTKLYLLASDFTFMTDKRGIYGVGSGSSYAMGYLWSRRDEVIKTQRLAQTLARKAVHAAMEFDINTGGEVDVVLLSKPKG